MMPTPVAVSTDFESCIDDNGSHNFITFLFGYISNTIRVTGSEKCEYTTTTIPCFQ